MRLRIPLTGKATAKMLSPRELDLSGEHRLPACSLRQLAEKLFERSVTEFL